MSTQRLFLDKLTHLVEVDAHALELELRSAIVDTIAVEAVLARNGLPESSTNLVTLSKHCERARSTFASARHVWRLKLLTHCPVWR